MPKRAIILVAEIEVGEGETAHGKLDAFRESVLPEQNHGITFYRPVGSVLRDLLAEGANYPEGSPVVEDPQEYH